MDDSYLFPYAPFELRRKSWPLLTRLIVHLCPSSVKQARIPSQFVLELLETVCYTYLGARRLKIIQQGVHHPMIDADLLEILRCPHCVSGPTRHAGEDPGRLMLVRESWLVCQESDCQRKYPIADGIPVMLIETGDKWRNTPIESLQVPPPKE
jgi:hypothetical protein